MAVRSHCSCPLRARAVKLLEDGSAAVADDHGKGSDSYAQLQLALVTVLTLTGDFQRVIDVCEALKPCITAGGIGDDAMAYTCLRQATACVAVGELERAASLLKEPVRCAPMRELRRVLGLTFSPMHRLF